MGCDRPLIINGWHKYLGPDLENWICKLEADCPKIFSGVELAHLALSPTGIIIEFQLFGQDLADAIKQKVTTVH